MFYRYLSIFFKLRSVDISSWNTDKVTAFNRMFWNCQKLTDVKMNCSKTSLTEAGVKEMFTNCYLLQTVDMSSFDFHNANDFTSIFSNCNSLQTIVFGKSNTSNIIYMNNAFAYVGGNGEFTCVDADFSSATIVDKLSTRQLVFILHSTRRGIFGFWLTRVPIMSKSLSGHSAQ